MFTLAAQSNISMKMKPRIILFALAAIILLQACNRAMTPYEAANNPKGKKCRNIR